MSESTKQTAANPAVVELRRIRVGINALAGTGNVLIGSGIVWFGNLPTVGADFAKMLAGCFILCGLIQKLFSLTEWVEIYRNR